jgi:hypothetical protein
LKRWFMDNLAVAVAVKSLPAGRGAVLELLFKE